MNDDIDVEALITAVALTIRSAGIPVREARAQVADMITEAYATASIYEAELAEIYPETVH